MSFFKQSSPAHAGLGMDGWGGRPEKPKEERWEWMVGADGPKGRKRKGWEWMVGADGPKGRKRKGWEWMVGADGPKGRKRKAQSRGSGAGEGLEGGEA